MVIMQWMNTIQRRLVECAVTVLCILNTVTLSDVYSVRVIPLLCCETFVKDVDSRFVSDVSLLQLVGVSNQLNQPTVP